MTAFEALVIIVCLAILAIVLAGGLLPRLTGKQARITNRIRCEMNLKQISLAFYTWSVDHNNQSPMAVSVTNGGAMELFKNGSVSACVQLVSNEMISPKIFVCPNDPDHYSATNWKDINESHISYFFGADATNGTDASMVFSGDDNLIANGMPVKSGMFCLSSKASVSWSGTRHKFWGNICFADGHIAEESQHGLQQAFQATGLATNRIVVP